MSTQTVHQTVKIESVGLDIREIYTEFHTPIFAVPDMEKHVHGILYIHKE